MGPVRGRYAAVLSVCAALPTALVHLLTQARLTTLLVRTCLAMGGAFAVGLLLETYLHELRKQMKTGQPPSGHRLNIAVGSSEVDRAEMHQLLTDEQMRERTS